MAVCSLVYVYAVPDQMPHLTRMVLKGQPCQTTAQLSTQCVHHSITEFPYSTFYSKPFCNAFNVCINNVR